MFSDIVGYTSLMGENEEKAFETINTNREIHQRLIEKYHGTVVKELGDGLLSVFENGTEAVQCAIHIQQEAGVKKIPLRIGIHEGEVVIDNDDVFGDGVNIASRIQDEAARGGICISDSVYRIIKNKTDIRAVSIGTRHLKNVDETIKLYQVKATGVKTWKAYSGLKRSKSLAIPIILLVSLLLITVGWFLNDSLKSESSDIIERYNIVLPAEKPVVCKEGVLPVAISPDGTTLVYQTLNNNKSYICKRNVNQTNTEIIPGTEGGRNPFFSPDGKWIAFYTYGKLKKVLISGGNPVDLCDVPTCSRGVWLKDNTIVISEVGKGLIRVSAGGGTPTAITSIDTEKGDWAHNFPHCLPDGKTILYSAFKAGGEPLYIKSINLQSHKEKVILNEASCPIYSKTGHLIYAQNGHLMSAPFDSKKLQLKDPAVILLKNVVFNDPSLSLSENGTFVYVPDQTNHDELVWLDMDGNIETIFKDNMKLWGPRISPDGNRIALWKTDSSSSQVYIYHLIRQTMDKFTHSGENFWPVWSPDGTHIAFPTMRGEKVNIYWKAVDTSSPAESILAIESMDDSKDLIYQPQTWTSDSRYLLYVKSMGFNDNWDIMILDMQNRENISEFITTDYNERHPRLSPDNRLVAYQSDETGRLEIYVTKFPEAGLKWKISSGGGYDPLWSPDGNKIFYRNGQNIMVVNITNGPIFSAGKPEVLFSGKFRQMTLMGWYYDIHPDGDKFVMVKGGEIDTTQNHINIIKNFSMEIEKRFASAM